MFSIELLVKPKENRRSPRMAVDMPGRLTSTENWRTVCHVVDISRHGAKLSTFSTLQKGMIVWLNLPGQPARKGEIIWSDEYSAACKFMIPLDDDAVMSLVGRYGFDVETDRPLESMILVA